MWHLVVNGRVPGIGKDRAAREGLKAGLTYKTLSRLRHDNLHAECLFTQESNQLAGFVSSNAARDAEDDMAVGLRIEGDAHGLKNWLWLFGSEEFQPRQKERRLQ